MLYAFGLGYCARRLARTTPLRGSTRDGREVDGQATDAFDGSHPLDRSVLDGVTHVLVSIPPGEHGDVVLAQHADDLKDVAWVGLLSTIGVYGDHGGAWVDHRTPPQPTHDRGRRRVLQESQWTDWAEANDVPLQIFRLGGIYGPGERNGLHRLRLGRAVRVIKPGHVSNRIHVDDIVRTIRAGMAHPEHTGVFDVVDGTPLPPQDVLSHGAALLGIEPPPEVPWDDPSIPPFVRSFYEGTIRVRNDRIRQDLGVEIEHSDAIEGLSHVHREAGAP